MSSDWNPQSWKALPATQLPNYSDLLAVERITSEIRSRHPIVAFDSVLRLKERLKALYASQSDVLIHAGDCAETFKSCTPQRVVRDSELILSLSTAFAIGRICGQFAKPRSQPIEFHNECGIIPAFRGDIINSFDPESRMVDPERMRKAHELSMAMYRCLETRHEEFYISHECLLLPYEECLIKRTEFEGFYSSSAHFLWIGDRTRDLNGSHLEFCRGIENPVGIKVGPTSNPEEIKECVLRLNPLNEPGKVTVITRYGVGNAASHMPCLIEQLRGLHVLYQCDPMHGNTVLLESGKKTRYVESIKQEMAEVVDLHRSLGSRIHGLHLEVTGANVTECIGVNVSDPNLPQYESLCDPRLNAVQAKHVVDFFYKILADQSRVPTPLSRLTTVDTTRSDSSNHSSDEERSVRTSLS